MIASGTPASGHWSRSCTERVRLPSPVRAPTAFARGLAEIATDAESILLPGGDAALGAISRHRSLLEPRVMLGLPPHAAVERTVDKVALIDAAAGAGLPCPPTVLCTRPETATAIAAELGFPVVVKPRSTVFAAGETYRQRPSRIVWDEAQLTQHVGLLAGPFLLQQHEVGQVHSCSGVFAGGRMLAFATSRYWRTFPPDGGPVSFGETIEPPPGLAEQITALVRDARLAGPLRGRAGASSGRHLRRHRREPSGVRVDVAHRRCGSRSAGDLVRLAARTRATGGDGPRWGALSMGGRGRPTRALADPAPRRRGRARRGRDLTVTSFTRCSTCAIQVPSPHASSS